MSLCLWLLQVMGPQSVLLQGEIFIYLQTISARRWLLSMYFYERNVTLIIVQLFQHITALALCYALKCQMEKIEWGRRGSQEFLPPMILVFWQESSEYM